MPLVRIPRLVRVMILSPWSPRWTMLVLTSRISRVRMRLPRKLGRPPSSLLNVSLSPLGRVMALWTIVVAYRMRLACSRVLCGNVLVRPRRALSVIRGRRRSVVFYLFPPSFDPRFDGGPRYEHTVLPPLPYLRRRGHLARSAGPPLGGCWLLMLPLGRPVVVVFALSFE